MAVVQVGKPKPKSGKRLLFLSLLAMVGLAAVVWQRLPPSPAAKEAARIAAADRLTEGGAAPAAVEQLKSLIVANPGSAQAYLALGNAYLAQGRYDLAVQPLEMASSLAPEPAHVECRLADAYLHTRDRDAAVRSIQTALKREPTCARAHLVAGEQWLRDDDLTHALADFREAARLAPDSPLAYQRAGYVLLELDRGAEAEQILLAGLRVGPDDVGIHLQLGRMYALRTTDPQAQAQAEAHYLRALPGNPDPAAIEASLGEIAMNQGKRDDARRWWDAALRDNRNEGKALYALAQLFISSGKKAEGQALLKRYAGVRSFQQEMSALRMQTTTRPTRALRLSLARKALDAGQLDAAERQLAPLVAEFPADPVIRNLQGDLYLLQQREDDAQREYSLASALPPEPVH